MMGADSEALVRAQGVALSLSSGSMAFLDDGSWTKRLHPGWAASAACRPRRWRSGFQGPAEDMRALRFLRALRAGHLGGH